MVYIGDIEFHNDEIISPDGYSIQVDNICGDSFQEILKSLTHKELNESNLKKLYGDNINLIKQNMTIIYGDDQVGLYSQTIPKIPGSSTKEVNGHACFVPPFDCLAIMDPDDGDDDPDTNDFYFIFKGE